MRYPLLNRAQRALAQSRPSGNADVRMRVHLHEREAWQQRAAVEGISLADVFRKAMAAYLATPVPTSSSHYADSSPNPEAPNT